MGGAAGAVHAGRRGTLRGVPRLPPGAGAPAPRPPPGGLPEEAGRQLRIEQVRELGAELSLTSHAGGYKVGDPEPRRCSEPLRRQCTPEDARGAPAAHPPGAGRDPALAPAADHPQPLPAAEGAAPRAAPRPSPGCARRRAGQAAGSGALDALGEAPLAVVASGPGGSSCRRQRHSAYAGGARRQGSADPVATAERWARADLALRLQCFENWLTERIRAPGARGSLFDRTAAWPLLVRGASGLEYTGAFRAD